MIVSKNAFKWLKVDQEHSLTALLGGFTNKFSRNVDTLLNNDIFVFEICLNLIYFNT